MENIGQTVKETLTNVMSGGTENTSSNVVDILKSDHRKVEKLISQVQSSHTLKEKVKIIEQIVKELAVHSTIEEKLVYPLLANENKEKIEEAYEEHHVVKLMLAELADLKDSEDQINAKVKVLGELVMTHVKEEEHDILPKLKDMGVNLEELGRQVLEQKHHLLARVTSVGEK